MGDFLETLFFLMVVAGFVMQVSRRFSTQRTPRFIQSYIQQVQKDWQQAGYTIHYPPTKALYYGNDALGDLHFITQQRYGALGIFDDRLVFDGQSPFKREYAELNQIRWIGTRTITVDPDGGGPSVQRDALIVHFELKDQWRVAAFVIDSYQHRIALTTMLSEMTGLSAPRLFGSREDFGPERTLRMTQDIYGQWSPPPDNTDVPRKPLYLAPDRLLYNFREAIQLAQIRRVDVYEEGDMSKYNPFNQELLRIEYDDAEGQVQVLGFLLFEGLRWAIALDQRLTVPVEIHTGRKKKTT